MKRWLIALCVVFAFGRLGAQTPAWQPSEGHTQVPIWPAAAPDSQPVPGPEKAVAVDSLVAGKPWVSVSNVSQPTMTVYSPKGPNTGAAVVVLPGGGFMILAIDLEGTEACDWLSSHGITAVLLKYRVPFSGAILGLQDKARNGAKSADSFGGCTEDSGSRAPSCCGSGIDPNKIGVLGFSAGGYLVAQMSTHFDRRLYAAVDAADKESCRPDFARWPSIPGTYLSPTTASG